MPQELISTWVPTATLSFHHKVDLQTPGGGTTVTTGVSSGAPQSPEGELLRAFDSASPHFYTRESEALQQTWSALDLALTGCGASG